MALQGWRVLIGRGAQETATWVFVLSFLTLGVGRDYAYIECAGLVLPAFVAFILLRHPIPKYATARIALSTAVLVLIVGAYVVLGSWPASFGAVREYEIQAAYFVVTYLIVCA